MKSAKTLRMLGLMLCMPNEESLPLLEELAADHPWMQAGLHELTETPLDEWQTGRQPDVELGPRADRALP